MTVRLKNFLWMMAGIWTLGVGVYYFSITAIADLRYTRLDEVFGLTALILVYLDMLAVPTAFLFGKYFWAQVYKSVEKTLIGIALLFQLLHGAIAFFILLGGFAGFGFLDSRFRFGIIFSVLAAASMALALVDWKKSPKFFQHGRIFLIYLAGIFATLDALILNNNFYNLTALFPKIYFIGLAVLVLISAAALDEWMRRRQIAILNAGINAILSIIILSFAGFYYFNPKTVLPSSNPHAGHNMTGMVASGDPAKRYTVSFAATPANPKPGQNISLAFKVYDAASGNEVTDYEIIFDKLLHLVIVDQQLSFFNHIHPDHQGSTFTITTQFPHDGVYHLYLNFQPSGGAEQQFGFTLPVGNPPSFQPIAVDNTLTKTFGNYQISLSTADGRPFNAQNMSNAAQVLVFDFKNAQTGEPITDLQPYLGAFGHLVLINQETYEYVHIHPLASDNPVAGGPQVKFLPAALYAKIKPGIYRVFGQFKRNGQVFVADFTVNVN
jgi:hypothetical protein